MIRCLLFSSSSTFPKRSINSNSRSSKKFFSTVNGYPLQADIPSHAPPPTGYNLILNRIANIMMNITEKQFTKTLVIYPQDNLLAYLDEVDTSLLLSLRSKL